MNARDKLDPRKQVVYDALSAHDRGEIDKFAAWLGVEASRKAGGDVGVLNALEQVIYPEGIGREPTDGGDA